MIYYDYNVLIDETDTCLAKSCANQIKQILIPKYIVGKAVAGYRCERYRNDDLDRFSLILESMKKISFYEIYKEEKATLSSSGKEIYFPVVYKLSREQIKNNIIKLLNEDESLRKYNTEKITDIILDHFKLSQHYYYFVTKLQNEFKY